MNKNNRSGNTPCSPEDNSDGPSVIVREVSILRTSCELAVEALVVFMCTIFLLEFGSRLMHLGHRPAIPHIYDGTESPRMPADMNITAKLSGKVPFSLCTDDLGIRQIQCDRDRIVGSKYEFLIFGDSQIMGWGIDAEKSIAGYLSTNFETQPSQIGIVSVAGADAETLYPWASEIADRHYPQVKHVVLSINLGNDLDEMFLGRLSGTVNNFKGLREWFSVNSFFYLDFMLLKQFLFGGEWTMAPGANPALFMMEQGESRLFARAIADSAKRLLDLWPDSNVAVLLIPNDYQIDATEFDKYEAFYPSNSVFSEWKSQIPEAIDKLNRFESDISNELMNMGIAVINISDAIRSLDPLVAFDRRSHHLNPEANQQIAEKIHGFFRLPEGEQQ